MIDDVGVWSRVLDAGEIAQLANQTGFPVAVPEAGSEALLVAAAAIALALGRRRHRS